MLITSPIKFYQVAQIILQIWPCDQTFGCASISKRKVIITSILYGFDQKKQFFSGLLLVQVQ